MKKYSFDDHLAPEIEAAIDAAVLNKRRRRVMKLRFIDGLSYEEIGADPEVDRTERQVGRIISAEAPKLKALLKSE